MRRALWSRHTRPVLLATFALNYLWDDSPGGFRAVNIFIHLANILLLYFLLIRIFSITAQNCFGPNE